MRSLGLLAAALLMPATLHAGGAPGTATPYAGGASGVMPAVVCYPENRFELCPTPPAGGHPEGYLPRTVPARVFVSGQGARFAVLVSPNVIPYREAMAEASAAARVYCGREAGERIAARIDSRARYADADLGAWRFGGRCD